MRIAVFLLWFVVWTGCHDVVVGDELKNVNQVSKNDAFDGWINLFSGDTRFGWRAVTRANWRCDNQKELTVSEGEAGLFRTTTQFDQFTLGLEFKAAADTNSGVFLRTSPSPRDPTRDCYEINIASASNPYPTGSIVGRVKGKPLPDFDYSAWHSMEIRCIGRAVTVLIDGMETATYVDPKHLGKGYIGLQFNEGPVAFRNLILKPEGMATMFDGKSLAGWKTYPEMKSRFLVKGGILNVQDGPGQLETRGNYRNFVMQLKVKTNAPGLNSGIFFRCIPGEKMNGYESQIQNEMIANDRMRPKDCGTGGIFRRKNARRIVAGDQEWFIKTLIVDGPHISTWVNGTQVCDWTDQRKADSNPRKGLRLEGGTVMIQGHDPTTDIDFRDLMIREIQDRWPGR